MAPPSVLAEIATEQQKVTAEIRELDLLIESTQTEVNRLRSREDQLKTKVEEVRQNPANHQREEIFSTTDEFNVAMSRRMTMEGQLGALVAKRKLIDRSAQILNSTQRTLAEYSAPALPADATPLIDESRLPSDDEVAIFRLIQDSLVERIQKAQAKDLVLGMTWKEDVLEILLQSDGKELPPDGELQSGIRRSERLELLRGDSTHETRPDGTVVLNVKVPIRSAPQLVG